MIELNENAGRFTASRISGLLAGGQTRYSLIYELARERVGLKKNIKTKAMSHGNDSEWIAAEYVKMYYPESVYQSDESIMIDENSSATPDFVLRHGNAGLVIDAKCPQLNTFKKYQHDKSIAIREYGDQLQMQQLALKKSGATVTHGKLFILLKKFGNDDYTLINDTDNHFFIDVFDDEVRQKTIELEIKKAAPVRDELVDCLLNAEIVDVSEIINKPVVEYKFSGAMPKEMLFSEGTFWRIT